MAGAECHFCRGVYEWGAQVLLHSLGCSFLYEFINEKYLAEALANGCGDFWRFYFED